MVHVFDFFNEPLDSLSIERNIKVADFQDDASKTPNISFAVITPLKFLRLLRVIYDLWALI
jgi:hypothetical protein